MPVSKEIKETITMTIDEVFQHMNSIAWIDRQKIMKEEAFKNTEKILYNYTALKEHIEDEDEYLSMALRKKSKSIIKYTSGNGKAETDQILKDRLDSYNRSKSDLIRIEKALGKIKNRKGYEVIEYRYLLRKDSKRSELYTYDEITELLAGKNGYSQNLNEKTVRNYKNSLIKEVAVLMFGSDAI